MRRAIYILSLEHSGSTLLSLAISAHPKVISFGEVEKVINASTAKNEILVNSKCLCGQSVSNCNFWGPILNEEALAQCVDDTEAYEKILRVFYKQYGEEAFFLDSSKIINNLKALLSTKKIETPKIIFLIKDVRSYTVSSMSKYQKHAPDSGKIPSRRGTIRHWYLQNRAMLRYLNDNKLDYFLMGYEEFCLHTDMMLNKICDYLGIEFDSSMHDLAAREGHQVFGNRMRKQPQKNNSIMYDNRWFKDLKTSQLLSLMPKTWRFNLETVYSNTEVTMWDT
jgi:hypothetical protein